LISIHAARLLHQKNWGLPDYLITMVIAAEKMQDVTALFSDQIKSVIAKFGNASQIRIAAFNDKSGADGRSKEIFKELIQQEREVMYCGDMSNKGCCVLFLDDPKGMAAVKNTPEILAHEYAHHYQFAHAGFPYYFSKSQRMVTGAPAFSTPYEMGTKTEAAFMDGVQLPEWEPVIEDSLERVSDIICEGILREKKIPSSIEKLYIQDLARPAPSDMYPKEIVNRYVKRLGVRDFAELGAILKLSGSGDAESLIQKGREKARILNKNHMNANKAFDAIHTLCLATDFNLFKDPIPTMSYVEKVLAILKITVKPGIV